MINIKPCDFIFFQDLNPETTTTVFIFRGCDQNTKLDSRMNHFLKKKKNTKNKKYFQILLSTESKKRVANTDFGDAGKPVSFLWLVLTHQKQRFILYGSPIKEHGPLPHDIHMANIQRF